MVVDCFLHLLMRTIIEYDSFHCSMTFPTASHGVAMNGYNPSYRSPAKLKRDRELNPADFAILHRIFVVICVICEICGQISAHVDYLPESSAAIRYGVDLQSLEGLVSL